MEDYETIKEIVKHAFPPPNNSNLFDSGVYSYMEFISKDRNYINKFLGEPKPEMTAEEAAKLLEHSKLIPIGQLDFINGWNKARSTYLMHRRKNMRKFTPIQCICQECKMSSIARVVNEGIGYHDYLGMDSFDYKPYVVTTCCGATALDENNGKEITVEDMDRNFCGIED